MCDNQTLIHTDGHLVKVCCEACNVELSMPLGSVKMINIIGLTCKDIKPNARLIV